MWVGVDGGREMGGERWRILESSEGVRDREEDGWRRDVEIERRRRGEGEITIQSGGPGGSSLFGLFSENGPYSVTDDLKLVPKNVSVSHSACTLATITLPCYNQCYNL